MLQTGVIGGPCVVWHSRRERQGWKLKPMKEERREKQRQTQQSVYHQRMSSSVMDAAVPAVLELDFIATSENACRNRAKSWTCPTTAYLLKSNKGLYKLCHPISTMPLSLE